MNTEKQIDDLHEALASTESELRDAREALARVEADREFLNGHSEQMRLHAAKLQAELDTVQAQLAEAVGLIESSADLAGELGDYLVSLAKRHSGMQLLDQERNLRTFLARHTPGEQQEAREPVLARPEHGVSLDEALALTMDRYSSAMEKLAASEQQDARISGSVALRGLIDGIDHVEEEDFPAWAREVEAAYRADLATQPAVRGAEQ